MMRIEIASNLQTSSVYGDRRAAAAAQRSEEKQSANTAAQTAEVKDSSWRLESPSDWTSGIEDNAARAPSSAPLTETDVCGRASTDEKDSARTEDDLKKFVSELSKLSQMSSNRLEFEFDSEAEISVIRVVDKETGELVWRVPPEKLLAAMDDIFNTQGIVLDQTA
ncbi:MAG: flagellar protein FlaG [Candidatus Coatesbacteria bacterium]|nr:flagellar protein FlaG [Candidatus Coatesbacteria bacterium]